MKREEKLLEAIGSVQDYMVQEAMRRTKRPPAFRWTAIAACICLVLTATVGAAKWGIEWWHGENERYEQYTVDWKYPLAPVQIREEAVSELERWLQWGWGVDGMDEYGNRATWPDSYYIGAYLQDADELRSVADLEEYLGIDLTTSPEIDASCQSIGAEIDVTALTELIADAEIEYAETGRVSLGGVEVDLNLGYLGTNCKTRMKMFIPVTENFVEDFPAKDWWFAATAGTAWSDYEIGQFEVEELTISGREVVIFSDPTDDLEDCPTALAVYSDGRIGYLLYCIAEDWSGYDSRTNIYRHGSERLMELLEELE